MTREERELFRTIRNTYSHHISNPLTIAHGKTSILLQKGNLTPLQETELKKVLHACDRIAAFMKTFSKVEKLDAITYDKDSNMIEFS